MEQDSEDRSLTDEKSSSVSNSKSTGSTSFEKLEPAIKPRGRFLAGVSFLMALTALSGGAYLYYLFIYLNPLTALEQRITGLESNGSSVVEQLRQMQTEQPAALETFQAEQVRRLAVLETSLIDALNTVSSQAPPPPRVWKLAEAEYLLRIANHRLLMERDVTAALELLRGADQILLEIDDFGFYEVRAQLADEMLALGAVRDNDLQGIYLRLEAVKGEIVKLPLQVPEYLLIEDEDSETGQEVGFVEGLRAQFASYLRFRRLEGGHRPLLAPEEAVYLELNLRLMLERAQLAALRRQQVVFEQSIATAREWIVEFLATDEYSTRRLLAELEGLAEVELNLTLPDISGSLTALKAARRGPQ